MKNRETGEKVGRHYTEKELMKLINLHKTGQAVQVFSYITKLCRRYKVTAPRDIADDDMKLSMFIYGFSAGIHATK